MLLMRLQRWALAEARQGVEGEVFTNGGHVGAQRRQGFSAVKDPARPGVGGVSASARTSTAGRRTNKAVDSVASDETRQRTRKFCRQGSSDQHRDGVLVLGVNSGARRWAQKLGVDPYTTNPILKKALTDIGQIDAAGGIAAKVVVPIPMVVSGTASVGGLVWSKDPEALLKGNEQAFKELGVGPDVIKQLYVSKGFSLTLHTRFANNLSAVHVPGCADYVATAAEADTEREALFFVESAEMLARFHKTAPVTALLPDSRALVAKTKDGRAVVMLPVDWVRWAEGYEKALGGSEACQAELGNKLELRITGTMSAVAKQEMATRLARRRRPSTFGRAVARRNGSVGSARKPGLGADRGFGQLFPGDHLNWRSVSRVRNARDLCPGWSSCGRE
jgi:hypothetical protein